MNSIHSIAELSTDPDYGAIDVQILRVPQAALQLEDDKPKRGAPTVADIVGFKVTDNGGIQ